MGILSGITKIALSPIKGVAEIFDDIKGDNSEEEQGVSIMTAGISSLVKGTFKGLKKGVEDIFDDV